MSKCVWGFLSSLIDVNACNGDVGEGSFIVASCNLLTVKLLHNFTN
jgi:hypothetical protein